MKTHMMLATCLGLVASSVHAEEPTPSLPLSTLIDVAQTAIAACSASGWPVAVTILDMDLSMRVMLRADGAARGLVDISHRKAYTVIKSGMASADFAKTLPPEVLKAPESEPVNGDAMLIAKAGGVPILVNGKLVGAIGVSGRPKGADVDCANAGLAKIPASGK